jgi:hypothetical protein
MLVLESSFNAETMAAALAIPPSKSYIRRHLTSEVEALLKPARWVPLLNQRWCHLGISLGRLWWMKQCLWPLMFVSPSQIHWNTSLALFPSFSLIDEIGIQSTCSAILVVTSEGQGSHGIGTVKASQVWWTTNITEIFCTDVYSIGTKFLEMPTTHALNCRILLSNIMVAGMWKRSIFHRYDGPWFTPWHCSTLSGPVLTSRLGYIGEKTECNTRVVCFTQFFIWFLSASTLTASHFLQISPRETKVCRKL